MKKNSRRLTSALLGFYEKPRSSLGLLEPHRISRCLLNLKIKAMEINLEQEKQQKDSEEYVLLDLDDACVQTDIPANVPYILSGLDTLNPVLMIGDRLKLIGEYQETIGTCYLFAETDKETMVLHQETEPSERNLIKKSSILYPNPAASSKKVQPITGLHKILKFRLATEDETETRATSISATNL